MRRTILVSSVGVLLVACAVACSKQEPVSPAPGAATADALEMAGNDASMKLHTLGGVRLASQPKAEDFVEIQASGVKTVINLRHPAEIKDFDEKAVVESHHMVYVNVPCGQPEELTDEIFDSVRHHLANAERPILMHCSSGNRVGAVWLPYRVLDGNLSFEEALVEAKTIGLKSPEYEARARAYIESHQ